MKKPLLKPKKKKKFPFSISPVKKKQGIYCCAYNCYEKPAPRKGGLCHKHYRRKRKFLDPVYDRYNSFKSNAIKRGKEFSVTLEEFRQFCIDNNYIIQSGRRGFSATIDRKWNEHGYHLWNLRIVSHRFNASKGDGEYEGDDECPF